MSDKSSVTRQEPAADASKPPKPIDHKLWLGIDIYDTQAKADPGGSKTSIDLGTFSGNPPSEQDDADKEEENKGINQLFEKRELIQTSTAGDGILYTIGMMNRSGITSGYLTKGLLQGRTPAADLWEAEGELNKGAVCKTTKCSDWTSGGMI